VAEVTKGYGQGVNKGQISNYLFRAIIPNAKLIRAALKKGENPDLLPLTGMSGQMNLHYKHSAISWRHYFEQRIIDLAIWR
jgi:hypothetical protein